jgi:hypothetical protein
LLASGSEYGDRVRRYPLIAFVAYRLLLLPVTLALVVIWIFLPIGVDAHGLQRILTALWVIAIVPPLVNLVYEGWKRWSAR